MSALWPHPPYAEDQPHHHTILTTHVLHRGFQAGAILGSLAGALSYTYASLRKRQPHPTTPVPPSAVRPSSALNPSSVVGGLNPRRPLLPTLLRTTATGSLLGTALMAVMLPMRMRGRQDIEWRDRSWRLLENRGQVEVDSFGVVGAVLGGLGAWWATTASAAGGGRLAMGVGDVGLGQKAKGGLKKGLGAYWRGFVRGRGGMVVGGAGVGAGLGVLAYLGWRYGVNGGRWVEAVEEGVESAGKGAGLVGR